jgi:hypothetical protein
MKVGLNNKSGFQKLLDAQEYHKAALGVYKLAKVIFACDLSYHPSYYFPHRLYRIERLNNPGFSL